MLKYNRSRNETPLQKYPCYEEDNNSENINWITQSGKYVKLVQPDTPWYIVNDKYLRPEGTVQIKQRELNQVDYRNNADFKSNFVLDTTRPDMGYGTVYTDRAGQPCKCEDDCDNVAKNVYEGFSTNSMDWNNNKLVWILVILAIIMILFKIKDKY
tara:strand:- start:61513 stop:61980 length:468 start_codon:yes stop_codon:yes gene_type:complete